MKTRFTVAAIFALIMAFAAGSAFAALTAYNSSVGAAVPNTDGSKYRMQGFTIQNGTGLHPGVGVSHFLPLTVNGTFMIYSSYNTPTTGFFNHTVNLRNSSGTNFLIRQYKAYPGVTENSGPHGLGGFLSLKNMNASQHPTRQLFGAPIFVAPSPLGSFMAGVGNTTYNATSGTIGSYNSTNGTTFLSFVQMTRGGKAATVLDSGDTWYFYQILLNATGKNLIKSAVGYREGSFRRTASNVATVTYADSLNRTIRAYSDFALATTNGAIRLYKGNTIIIANGTMDNSTKIITGYGADAQNGTLTYTIALKGASVPSQSDMARGWRAVSAGVVGSNMSTAQAAAGAHRAKRAYSMWSSFAVKNDATSTTGGSMNGKLVLANSSQGVTGGLVSASPINLGNEQGKLTVSTVSAQSSIPATGIGYNTAAVAQGQLAIKITNTTRGGAAATGKNVAQIRGRWLGAEDGVFAGIYFGNNTFSSLGIFVGMANVATAGDVTNGSATGAQYCSNASGAVRFVNTFNGSEPKSAGVRAINFYGWDAVKTKFGLNGYTKLTTNWVTFNASVKGYDASKPVYLFQYPVTGISASDIANLALFEINNSTFSPTTGGPARNAKTTLSYSTSGTKTDGNWWLAETIGGAALGTGQALDPLKTYFLHVAIADNGRCDLDSTPGIIFDPLLLTGYTPAASGSSSSTGCVFNPTAGFGLEWLLLLIAPALGIIRSRLKK